MAAVKALQQWCKIQCDGYRDVAITNMTTSFRDGLAFCALIHKHRPDLIPFDSLKKDNVYDNNHLAFSVAEEQLGIPALLDAEDMVALRVPDRLSILTYVSQYYNYFHGKSPIGGMAGIKRPAEESSDQQPSGKKNQPITAKTYAPAATPTQKQPVTAKATQNQPITAKTYTPPAPATPSQREVLAERTNKTGTLSSSCSVCNKHVHLVQRHLVEGRLYHRNCFKCCECSTILLSGTYKPGSKPGTFMCTTHNKLSPPTIQSSRNPPSPNPSARNPPAADPPKKQLEFGTKFTPSPAKPAGPTWLTTKSDRTVTPTPTPTPTAAPRQRETTTLTIGVNATGKSDRNSSSSSSSSSTTNTTTTTTTTTRSPANQTVTHGSSPVSSLNSNMASKNQQARQRFFESATSNTPAKVPPSSTTEKKEESSGKSLGTGTVSGGGGVAQKKGRKLLKVGDWHMKEDDEEEEEKDMEKEKEKAKGFLGRKLAEEKNNNNLSNTNKCSSLWKVDGGKSTDNSGRVQLKPLDVSLSANTTPADKPSPPWLSKTNKDNKPAATPSKENDHTPTSWRSMLKPVAKETKPASSIDPVPPSSAETSRSKSPSRLWGGSSGKPQASGPTSTPTPSTGLAPAFLSTITSKDFKTPDTTPSKETPKTPKGKPEYIPKEKILHELNDIERNMNELERKGVEMEKQLRAFEEEGKEDVLQDDLMVDWFNLIRQKQVYMRRESELVYTAKTQDLEEQQPGVEAELRRLMDKPEHLKTSYDRKREEDLMAKLVEIVNDRNAIVDGLDEDRLREEEEDEQLNKMMENLASPDSKKDKEKKKSIKNRWFKKSKKEGTGS
ncbi:MICAL-like protein 2 [Engraulis encrasicolus]|uniref:MICAL-like protein 2 n=1 Tax=Engraulis encrasicolus TaxID=184585 RepID=UPI002FD01DED